MGALHGVHSLGGATSASLIEGLLMGLRLLVYLILSAAAARVHSLLIEGAVQVLELGTRLLQAFIRSAIRRVDVLSSVSRPLSATARTSL